jgi:hypothetical protein
MIRLAFGLLLLLVVALAIAIPVQRRRRYVLRARQRAKEQAYVAKLRAKWDEKHSEPAETFVERRRPWDGVERRKPRKPDGA